jgi:hypothetical protein
MALFDGTNAPVIKAYLDTGNRNSGIFTIGWSLLNGSDTLNSYTPFSILTQIPTNDVKQINIRRGRTREDQQFQPGQLTLILDNRSGNYDPENPSSTFVSSTGVQMLASGSGIRITATWGGTEYNLYSGYIESMDKDLSLAPTVTITCTDGLAKLGQVVSNFGTLGIPDSYAIDGILSSVDWNGGSSTHAYTTYYLGTVPNNTTALDMCSVIASQQLGRFFATPSGSVKFISGNHANSVPTTPMLLTDNRTVSNAIEYDEISVIGGEKYLLNTVNAVSQVGAPASDYAVTKFNATSVNRFGPHPVDVEYYLFYSADVDTAAQAYADHFATPAYRVDHVGFDALGLSSTTWVSILTSDLGSPVTVKRTPVYMSELTYSSIIEEFNHDITPTSWRVSMTLSPQ